MEDREMQCTSCGTRIFSSLAPELATSRYRCPRCLGSVRLMPVEHHFEYPVVRPATRRDVGQPEHDAAR
jgi:predicted RNA-binding Zn-ribbon protein involved in translation (DUF1610 family)